MQPTTEFRERELALHWTDAHPAACPQATFCAAVARLIWGPDGPSENGCLSEAERMLAVLLEAGVLGHRRGMQVGPTLSWSWPAVADVLVALCTADRVASLGLGSTAGLGLPASYALAEALGVPFP